MPMISQRFDPAGAAAGAGGGEGWTTGAGGAGLGTTEIMRVYSLGPPAAGIAGWLPAVDGVPGLTGGGADAAPNKRV